MINKIYTLYWQLKRSIKGMHFNLCFFVLGHLIWPLIMVATYFLSYTPLIDDSSNLVEKLTSQESLWSYLIPGIIVISLFAEYINIGAHLGFNRDYGILEPVFLSPVNRALWLVGGCSSIIPSGFVSSFSFVIWSSIVFRVDIQYPLILSLTTIVIIILSLPWGALVSSIFLVGRNARVLYAVFESPAEFFSGTRFPLTSLPGAIGGIALLYPLSHSVKLLRIVWSRYIDWNLFIHELIILMGLSLLYTILALVIFSFAEEKGKREGSLTFT